MDPRRLLGLAVGGAVAFACGSEDAAEKSKTLNKPDASLIDSPADVAHDHPGDAASDTDATLPYDGPAKLSETGLYSDMAQKKLAAEIRPYDVREPEWLDGTTSKRYILLPAGEKIDTSFMEVWKFPVGTKAWREISVQGTPVETRFLWKRAEGDAGWLQVSFAWNSAGDDALAVPGGSMVGEHEIPSSEVCTQCHNGQGDGLIGFAAIQLSKETGGGYLSTLISEGLLTDPPPGEFAVPGDGNAENLLIYMHANCGHCHSDQYWLAKMRVLRLKLLTYQTTTDQTGLYKTTINAVMDHNIAGKTLCVVPGKPEDSQLYLRCGMRGFDGMPPFDTKKVDPTGMAMIQDWINSLPPQ